MPTGWKNFGNPGTVTTTPPNITLDPDNGCVGGTVSVRGYINCNGSKKYSNAKTININRNPVNIVISGLNSSSCGVGSRTYTVTSIPCATNYQWNFPWLAAPVFSSSNSITVTPSGTASDNGNIIASINLSCGTSLPSNSFSHSYSAPVINIPAVICSSGTSVSLSNVPASLNVVRRLLVTGAQ